MLSFLSVTVEIMRTLSTVRPMNSSKSQLLLEINQINIDLSLNLIMFLIQFHDCKLPMKLISSIGFFFSQFQKFSQGLQMVEKMTYFYGVLKQLRRINICLTSKLYEDQLLEEFIFNEIFNSVLNITK